MKNPTRVMVPVNSHRGTAPLARSSVSAAPISMPDAATRLWRLLCAAAMPPATMPTMPPNRNPVSAALAATSGAPYKAVVTDTENVCRPIRAME